MDSMVRDYRRLRSEGVELNAELVEALKPDEVMEAARALGMLDGKQIALETQDEIGVLMDFAIHNVYRDGINAVDRMLRENPPAEGSDRMRLLHSLQASHHSILIIESVIPGIGVRACDGPKQTPLLLIDLGFGDTARAGMAVATRIHSPGEGWWMTTGAALPLSPAALDRIIEDLEVHERSHPEGLPDHERTRLVVRACLSAGASQKVRYQTPMRSSKVGRNEPCPCGSGRKYKKCCGG
jgi:hypothetical protein